MGHAGNGVTEAKVESSGRTMPLVCVLDDVTATDGASTRAVARLLAIGAAVADRNEVHEKYGVTAAVPPLASVFGFPVAGVE